MKKLPKLILNESLYIPNIKVTKISSMTNKTYKNNVTKVDRVIDENNRNFEIASQKIAKVLIKNSFEEVSAYSKNCDIRRIQEIACAVKCDAVSKVQINRAIEMATEVIEPEEFYSQTVYKNGEHFNSTKLSNIRFNFKYAIEIITTSFSVGDSILNDNKINLVLSILSLIREIYKITTIELSQLDAYMISYIVRMNKNVFPENELIQFISQQDTESLYDVDQLHKSVDNLDKLHVIELDNGVITIKEKILL